MKHKVGDKVRVRSVDWWDKSIKQKDSMIGEYIKCTPFIWFYPSMKKYLGKEVTIKEVTRNILTIEEDNAKNLWTNGMFEDEEEKPTKRNLEDNLWICDVAKERACEYFRVSHERMEEMKNEWKERLQSGDYV